MRVRRRYLKLRYNRWWFQMAVPDSCRTSVGKAVIFENLHTSDVVYAQAKALELAGVWQQRFQALRSDSGDYPSEIYATTLAASRAEIGRLEKLVADPTERGERVSLIYDWALERELERLGYSNASELKPGDIPPAIEAGLLATKAAVAGKWPVPPEYGTRFSQTAKAYLTDRQRAGSRKGLTSQTVVQMEAVYRLYRDHCADAPLGQTTRKSATAFFDKLKRLDANWGRSPRTKSRTLDDLLTLSAATDDLTPLSDRTLFRYMIALEQVWDWAKGRGEVEGHSPFAGQVAKGSSQANDGTAATPNAPWSEEALRAYFAAHPDGSEKGKPDPFFWLPRIALLSGLRLNEICSLRAEDIKKAEGVRYFDIVKSKTAAGVRVVPMHPALRPLLKMMPKTGPLFPDLSEGGPDRKRSWQIGKRLGRQFAATPGGSTFHAFRKNVAQTFERHRVPVTEAAQILGHRKADITYGVYSPNGLMILQKAKLVGLLRLPQGAIRAKQRRP